MRCRQQRMIVARRCDSAAAVAMRRTKNNLPLTLSKHSSAVQKMYIRRNEVTDFEFFFSIFFIRDGVLFCSVAPFSLYISICFLLSIVFTGASCATPVPRAPAPEKENEKKVEKEETRLTRRNENNRANTRGRKRGTEKINNTITMVNLRVARHERSRSRIPLPLPLICVKDAVTRWW